MVTVRDRPTSDKATLRRDAFDSNTGIDAANDVLAQGRPASFVSG
jgi:hypothetical protein